MLLHTVWILSSLPRLKLLSVRPCNNLSVHILFYLFCYFILSFLSPLLSLSPWFQTWKCLSNRLLTRRKVITLLPPSHPSSLDARHKLAHTYRPAYLWLCMCVGIIMCVYVFVCVHKISTHIPRHTHAHILVCLFMNLYIYIYTQTYIHTRRYR